MKKLFSILILFVLLLTAFSVSAQNFDLSQFSYSDLQAIAAQAQKEMMNRPEFQSVEVPVGLYVVGREIPAGQWTVTKTGRSSMIETGDTLESNQNEIDVTPNFYYTTLDDRAESQTITLIEGMYVQIKFNPIIFSTPTGVTFSFK